MYVLCMYVCMLVSVCVRVWREATAFMLTRSHLERTDYFIHMKIS